MRRRIAAGLGAALATLALTAGTPAAAQQQRADPSAALQVANPRHPEGTGPVVAIDQGHRNFHTINGRYGPFAQLLTKDGYRVRPLDQPISAEALAGIDVLVVANARGEAIPDVPSLTGPAFTVAEIVALRAWVAGGGRLFLIADHAPFPSAIQTLAGAFGVDWVNGYAGRPKGEGPDLFTVAAGSLADDPIVRGKEGVAQVRSFTGSAFLPPPDARPLMRLGPGWAAFIPASDGQISETGPQRPVEGYAQLAALPFGKGRVVFAGEAAMFTAQILPNGGSAGMTSPGAEGNAAALLNLMQWLSEPAGR